MIARLRLVLPLAWRSLWRNPRRTVITVLVVAVGLWSILAFAVLLKAWSQSSRDTTLRLVTGEGQIHAQGYLDDPVIAHRMAAPQGALAVLLNGPTIGLYSPRLRIEAIVQSEYKTLPVTLSGVVPKDEARLSVLPHQIADGRYLANADDPGIVLGRNLARRLKTRVGKRVVVLAQDAKGKLAERAFVVVGLFAGPQSAEDDYAFTGLATARSFTKAGSDLTEIAFDTAPGHDLDAALTALRKAAPGLDVQSWHTLAPLAYAVSTLFDQFIGMWLAVMFVLMAIGIVNTQLMAVFERTREFGLLQALGMRPRLVMLDVALESTLLIGIGVVFGIAMAVGSIALFPHGIDLGFLARGSEELGAGRVLYPRLDMGEFAEYSLIVWVLGVVAALWPARRASRVAPVEAMGRG